MSEGFRHPLAQARFPQGLLRRFAPPGTGETSGKHSGSAIGKGAPPAKVMDDHHSNRKDLEIATTRADPCTMIRVQRLVGALFAATLLLAAACAPPMEQALMTAYVDPGTPKSLAGLTLAIRPRGAQAASLEWDRARSRLAGELQAMGATILEQNGTDITPAPWVVSFTHGTDGPLLDTYERPVMVGRLRPGRPPFFEDPWESRTFTRTVYRHWLVMTLHNGADLGDQDPGDLRPVNELRLERQDLSPDDRAALPILLRAAARTFPGQEGPPSVIRVPPPTQ
ncbi:hypothetical protein [Rhodospirillum sp. A1_3_36]|uniref:hypothetical protein n=1 Tax=Rhodospirillum sp. A1_3_36 TaxID=3391666 RepID=UPI0039A552FB